MGTELMVPARKWVRSRDGIVAGVCGGLAKRFDVDPWLVRVIWIAAVAAFGTGILFYLLLAVCLPREDRIDAGERKKLLGVCRRVAMRSGTEVGIVRVMAVLLGLASLGSALIVYAILHFTLPGERDVIYL